MACRVILIIAFHGVQCIYIYIYIYPDTAKHQSKPQVYK